MKAIIELLLDDGQSTQFGQFIVPCTMVQFDEETNSIVIIPSSRKSIAILQDNCNVFDISIRDMPKTKAYILHSEIFYMRVHIACGKVWIPVSTAELKDYCKILKPLNYV